MQITLEDIAARLEPIRTHLTLDGGDIEVVRLSPDNRVLYIRLVGSCRTCDLSPTTVQLGVLEPLRRHFPFLEAVEVIPD
ncbi:MAG: NifU family protein [Bacteroidia bacterium]|nr:NifU family protein [Bacteroidia bacterium]MDW8133444.1 NifU family protein [Bacteroidia bacterium]